MIRDQLIGFWELVTYQFRLADRILLRPMGQGVEGLLLYDKSGKNSLQAIDPERPKLSTEDWMSASAEESIAAFEGIMTSYGTFEVDQRKGMVTHHVRQSSFPKWSGINREQIFELKDDPLTFWTWPMTMSGEQLVGQLIWKKTK